jgi:hypothetical protein
MQMARLSVNKSGDPFEVILAAALTQLAVRQADGMVPIRKAQPAMVNGNFTVTVGKPLTSTRGFKTAGCAWPPCEHNITDPSFKSNPGMVSFF